MLDQAVNFLMRDEVRFIRAKYSTHTQVETQANRIGLPFRQIVPQALPFLIRKDAKRFNRGVIYLFICLCVCWKTVLSWNKTRRLFEISSTPRITGCRLNGSMQKKARHPCVCRGGVATGPCVPYRFSQ